MCEFSFPHLSGAINSQIEDYYCYVMLSNPLEIVCSWKPRSKSSSGKDAYAILLEVKLVLLHRNGNNYAVEQRNLVGVQ